MLASADLKKGERAFKKCAACHKLEEGRNGVGPYLNGVVGRPVASAEGFNYSGAMKEYGGDWTPERLDEFLTKPRDVVPGTSMSFAGLAKEDERINVIGYLDSLSN
nr:cytochrome c family protein [Pontibaca salina]